MAYRIFISGMILLLAGFGIASIGWTASMFAVPGIVLESPAAFSEIRAFYGGLEIGLALCLVLAMLQNWPEKIVLTLVGVCFACVALARVASAVILGDTSSWTVTASVIEIVVSVIAFVLLVRPRKAK